MTIQLNNVLVPTNNLESSTQFFRDLIGLNLQHSGPTFAWFRNEHTNLMLILASRDRPVTAERGIYLEFVTDDLITFRDVLLGAGHTQIREWEQNNVQFLSVVEPGGNLIHVIQPA
ncbi:MAG: VOC family protein [Pseudomonadota bacterium]